MGVTSMFALLKCPSSSTLRDKNGNNVNASHSNEVCKPQNSVFQCAAEMINELVNMSFFAKRLIVYVCTYMRS